METEREGSGEWLGIADVHLQVEGEMEHGVRGQTISSTVQSPTSLGDSV